MQRLYIYLSLLYSVTRGHQQSPKYPTIINNCNGQILSFNQQKGIDLVIDGHCNQDVVTYHVKSSENFIGNGYYEPYGWNDGAPQYQNIIRNGTVFILMRYFGKWTLSRNDKIIFYNPKESLEVPQSNWKSATTEFTHPIISKNYIHKNKPNVIDASFLITKQRKKKKTKQNKDLVTQLLHPAINNLGEYLHSYYIHNNNLHGITIDNLLNSTILLKTLYLKDIPIEKWIGPEYSFYCCDKKYRLNFNEWSLNRTNKYTNAVVSLLSNNKFISFLESLSGICVCRYVL
jgi:hypothetical protein